MTGTATCELAATLTRERRGKRAVLLEHPSTKCLGELSAVVA
jgi:hypothetical protein